MEIGVKGSGNGSRNKVGRWGAGLKMGVKDEMVGSHG